MTMERKEKKIIDPVLDFEPLFYIIDKCGVTVLAAKKQDKYEVSGVYVRMKNHKWIIWPANFNNQLPWEFPERFVITKDKDEAWLFALMMSTCNPLPDDWCLRQYPRSADFPKY